MSERRLGYRWTICALLFAATTLNYVDRQVLGVLGPTLQRELHWTESQYGDIVSWFSLPYAIAFAFVGRWLDRVGVRRGLGTAVIAWSLAAITHAFARTTAGFSAARAALGLTESANFPGSIKTVAEWFPQKERALATGIFNAGTNMGAVVAPIMVPWIALTWGWRWAFIVTGMLGFLWGDCLVRRLSESRITSIGQRRGTRPDPGRSDAGRRDSCSVARTHPTSADMGVHRRQVAG